MAYDLSPTTDRKWNLSANGLLALLDDVLRIAPTGCSGFRPSFEAMSGCIVWTRDGTSIAVHATPGWEGRDAISVQITGGGSVVPDWAYDDANILREEMSAEIYLYAVRGLLATLSATLAVKPAPLVSKKFLTALDVMIARAHEVYDAWPRDGDGDSLDVGDMPSFDEHVTSLLAWRESLRSKS